MSAQIAQLSAEVRTDGSCRWTRPARADRRGRAPLLRRGRVEGRDRRGVRPQPLPGRPAARPGQGQRSGEDRHLGPGRGRRRPVQPVAARLRPPARGRHRHPGERRDGPAARPRQGGGRLADRDRHGQRRARPGVVAVGERHDRRADPPAPCPRHPAHRGVGPSRRGGQLRRSGAPCRAEVRRPRLLLLRPDDRAGRRDGQRAPQGSPRSPGRCGSSARSPTP